MLRTLHRCALRAESRITPTALLSTSRQSLIPITRISSGRLPASYTLPVPARPFSISIPRFQSSEAVSYSEQEEPVSAGLPLENGLPEFEQLRGKLHPTIVDTLVHDWGLKSMTEVQAKTLDAVLKGVDVVAQAKTGTGKTLGFLVPMVQRILESDPNLAERSVRFNRFQQSPIDVRGIIISPTRELAEQIAQEAKKLLKRTGIKVQLAVGGTQKSRDLQRAHAEGCHLLVGTPGRLSDILSDTSTGIVAPRIQAVVLDEADRLLEAGFASELDAIQASLPDPTATPRQNLMYSATISHEVVDLVQQILRPGFEFAQCVDPHEQPTLEKVDQRLVILPTKVHEAPALIELLRKEAEKSLTGSARPLKAIIFFNSIAETIAMHSMLSKVLPQVSHGNVPVFTTHSQLTQRQRQKVSYDFRLAKSGILVTTDVTARGMDFPEVTHVIQMDIPMTKPTEYYIHRIGRTARAGKEGQGWLFVVQNRIYDARKALQDMPLKRDETLETPKHALSGAASTTIPTEVAEILDLAQRSFKYARPYELYELYVVLLRNSRNISHRDRDDYVLQLNEMTRSIWGMERPPAIPPRVASELGLNERIHGIVISDAPRREPSRGFGRQSGGFGSYGSVDGGQSGSIADPETDSWGQGMSSLRGAMGGQSGGRARGEGFQRGERNSSFGGRSRGGGFQRGGRNSSIASPTRKW